MQTTYIFLHEVLHPRSKGADGLRRIIRTPFRLGKPGPDEVLCLLLLYVIKGTCQPLCTSVGVLLVPFGPRGSITAGADMVGTNVSGSHILALLSPGLAQGGVTSGLEHIVVFFLDQRLLLDELWIT